MPEVKSQRTCDEILQMIREEIIPIFEKAVTDDELYFQNPDLGCCWERKNCSKDDCPVMGNLHTRCWQIAGTFCGGVIQGKFAEKYQNCKECCVFREACPTLVEELGENLNNMLYLLRKEKQKTQKHLERIDYLNKELLSSIENLDSRNKEIQELVITDKLTGLYNRHYMMTVMDDEVMRCQRKGYRFCILMIDVDDFKSLNDTYGHIYGDNVLSYLGTMIKSTTRKFDRAFRYGGEEFVVILPETDQTMAWVVAERIRGNFEEERFRVEQADGSPKEISRTLSIGLVRYENGMDLRQLLILADEAMYAAKSQGRNMVFRHGID